MNYRFVGVVATVALALGCGWGGASAVAEELGSLAPFVENREIAGGVTLLTQAGETLEYAASGFADVEKKQPMTKETLFAVASMTKPVTATAVMILQDDGKLSIDDPVSKYLPEFEKMQLKDGTPAGPITLRQLMTHTAGLSGSQSFEGSLEEAAREIATRKLEFAPGTKWQYSPGLTVCGRVVEVVSGQPFDEFLRKRLFEPLAMTNSTFRPNEEQQKRVAVIYSSVLEKEGEKERKLVSANNGYGILPGETKEGPNPSAGLYTTAGDLGRFYAMMLNGGELDGKRVLSREAVAEMTRVQTAEFTTAFTPGNGWGLGWCIVREPQGVTAMLSPGTFGHGGAFGTQGWIDPERKAIYVMLIAGSGVPNGDASPMRQRFQELGVKRLK